MDALGNPPLTGRQLELAQVGGCFTRLEAGRGTLLLVVAGAGMGKTRMALEAVAMAGSRGVPAGWGRSRLDGATPTLAPWAEALAGAGAGDLHALAEANLAGDRRLVFDEVVTRLHAAAPAVVVLDDLDAADDATLTLLGRVAGELPSLGLLVVATLRPEAAAGRPSLARLLREVSDEAACDVLELEPLAVDDAIECAEAMAERRLVPERVIAVISRSGGNPFLLGELVRATAEGVDPSLPRTAQEVLADRLAGLGPQARATLEALAVLGGEADVATLSAVAGPAPDALAAGLGPALAARLVGSSEGTDPAAREPVGGAAGPPLRFTHALVRDAIMATLAPDAEAALHRRAVDALPAAPLDPGAKAEALAHHALAASRDGGDAVDGDLVRPRAGRRSLVRSAGRSRERGAAAGPGPGATGRAGRLRGAVGGAGRGVARRRLNGRGPRRVRGRARLRRT